MNHANTMNLQPKYFGEELTLYMCHCTVLSSGHFRFGLTDHKSLYQPVSTACMYAPR